MTRVPVGPTPLERLDAFQQRHSWLGLPIAVAYRFFENSGMHLVAALAYYALVAAVPLLLLAAIAVATMLDFFPDLQPYLVRSPIASIPMVGERIRNPDGGNPSIWLLVIAGGLSILGTWDLLQKKTTLRRNYPILAHFRYGLESIGPEMRQYFIQSDTAEVPFSREQRALVYQRAKGVSDVHPFGSLHDPYAIDYEWINHSILPTRLQDADFRIVIGAGREVSFRREGLL